MLQVRFSALWNLIATNTSELCKTITEYFQKLETFPFFRYFPRIAFTKERFLFHYGEKLSIPFLESVVDSLLVRR